MFWNATKAVCYRYAYAPKHICNRIQRFPTCVCACQYFCKAPYTLSVKLSNFTVWHHTWWKNWVNSAVLTGYSAGLRTVLSSHLSHTELHSSLRKSQFPQFTCRHRDGIISRHSTELTKKKTNLMGNLCYTREPFTQFFVQFFYTVELHSLT
jgi:hypothetical protein